MDQIPSSTSSRPMVCCFRALAMNSKRFLMRWAIVDQRKVQGYLLSKSHLIGRFKAAFLARAGFEAANWADLSSALLDPARTGEAIPDEISEYGRKYSISGILKG